MAGVVSAANLGGVADPRLSMEPDAIGSKPLDKHAAVAPRRGSWRNPAVSFEEYVFYATQTREWEKTQAAVPAVRSTGFLATFVGRIMNKKERVEDFDRRTSIVAAPDHAPGLDEKQAQIESASTGVVSEAEWHTASRAARTATWGAVFYLITTDILGPYSVPWAMAQLGYGPGFALYTVFGAMAGVSGYLLWQQFLSLDSDRYPIKSYGDLGYRIYGNWFRILVNVLQSFQFFLNVTLLTISNGQGLAQLAQGPSGQGFLCFVVAEVIFMVIGFLLGQIRTLQRLSYLSNLAIWFNVFIIFMVMGVASNTPPDYDAARATDPSLQGPIATTAGIPEGKDMVDNLNGLMQAVFSFGGATLFCELMAEMRRPWDFWKGLLCADIFIYGVYIIFGMVVYSEQGQYAYNPAMQGLGVYAWQAVGNALNLASSVIAAILYGNIGIKVLYANIGREFLGFPLLESKKGKLIWVAFVPVYWALAWVVAAAIPQVSNLSAFVGAACILQFSYTFPPLMAVGFACQRDAMTDDETFDPATGVVTRIDQGVRRWARGYARHWAWNTANVLYFLGALCTAALGIYSSVLGMQETFATTAITPFSCVNPAG